MPISYSIYKNSLEEDVILRDNGDGTSTCIPADPANADYQAYLNKDTLPSNSAPAEKPKK
jgi:hypothetical protein